MDQPVASARSKYRGWSCQGSDPGEIDGLAEQLRREVDADTEIEVWFVPRLLLLPEASPATPGD